MCICVCVFLIVSHQDMRVPGLELDWVRLRDAGDNRETFVIIMEG